MPDSSRVKTFFVWQKYLVILFIFLFYLLIVFVFVLLYTVFS